MTSPETLSDEHLDLSPFVPAAPPMPRHDRSTYYGLIEDGCSYGLASYGDTFKVVLMGHEAFRRRGINLFCSFGGATAIKRVEKDIVTVVVSTKDSKTQYCDLLSFEKALALYFYGQLFREKADVREVWEYEDGEPTKLLSCEVSNDEALHFEASIMAKTFRAEHMPTAYAIIQMESHGCLPVYSTGKIGAENPGD